MSLLTTTDVRRDNIAATDDVVIRHLTKGFASVVEPACHDRFVTWAIAPNMPGGLGLSFAIRDYSTAQVELGARVCNTFGVLA